MHLYFLSMPGFFDAKASHYLIEYFNFFAIFNIDSPDISPIDDAA